MKLEWTWRFIELLRRYRAGRNDTEYALFLKMPRTTLQNLMRGEQAVSLEQAEIVLNRLGICPCKLLAFVCVRCNGADQNGPAA